jgi:hypothetical protein
VEWLELLKVLAPYVSLLATVIFGVLGWFFRDLIAQTRREIAAHREASAKQTKEQEEKMGTLQRQVLELRADLPLTFVLKTDHIRHITVLEHKIDDMRRDQNEALGEIRTDVKELIRSLPKRATDGA